MADRVVELLGSVGCEGGEDYGAGRAALGVAGDTFGGDAGGTEKRDAGRLNWKLVHGKAVPLATSKLGGRSRGVAALVGPGVAVREAMPPGRAWKRLWEAQRVQMVEFPPRAGLPKGLRIVNVYAPVTRWAVDQEDVERVWFQEMFIEAVSALDLGIPTLFAGDWNGTVHPERDYGGRGVRGAGVFVVDEVAGARGTVGGYVDIFPRAWEWTFRRQESMSRCDAVLACRAAIPLMAGLRVMSEVQDGGHSPVVVSLVPRVVRSTGESRDPRCRSSYSCRGGSCGGTRNLGRSCEDGRRPRSL